MGMLRHIIKNLEIIYSINQAVHQSFDLDEVFKVALDATLSLDNVDMGFIYLVDFGRREAVLQAHRNVPEDYIKRAGRIPYPKGITWKIIDSGKVVNIKDIQKDPDVGPAGRELGHHGVLGIPITAEGKVIGVIYFATYNEREFRAEEVELLSSIGKQIAISVAKAKLYRELSKRNQYQTIISTVTQAVHKSINLREVLENAVDSMNLNIDKADTVAIYLLEGQEAVLRANRGLPHQYVERAGKIPYPKGATWKTITEGRPLYCEDVDQDTVIGPAGRVMGIKSYLCTPIRFEGKPVGSLNLSSFKKYAFDEEELKLLSIVAQQIEAAIHNAKQAEVLRESEERCRTLIEHTYGVICEASIEGRFLYISPSDEVLGFQPSDLLGKSIFDNIHPEDHSAVIKEFQKTVRDFSSESVLFRYQHKNGAWHWIESTGKPYNTATGEVRVIIASRDITERKQNEERLKNSHERLQALAIHLQSVREEERTRIAREIHDELGQTLTGMQMSLSWLDKKLSKLDDSDFTSQSIIRKEIVNMSRLVDTAIQTVQEITTELRPVLLDDFGLRAAIEWQAQEFQTRTGIGCTCTSNVENVTLAKQLSTAIFRILQEALTNVVRHANATRVEIGFSENKGHLELEVIDNGKGINEDEITSSKSLGLLGMRERVLPFGGEVKIAGIPGKGTRLTVQIPLNR